MTPLLSHFPLGRLCCTPSQLIGAFLYFFMERLQSSCVCGRSMVHVPHMVITVSVNPRKFFWCVRSTQENIFLVKVSSNMWYF